MLRRRRISAALFQKRGDFVRKLMWFVIGFTFATVACVYGIIRNFSMITLILLPIAVCLLIGCRWKRFLRIPAVLLLAAALGVSWFSFYDRAYLSDCRGIDGEKVTGTVELTGYSYPNTYGWAAPGVVVYEGKEYKVLLYLNEELEAKPGDRVEGSFQLRYTANGGEKEPTYHRSQGIFLLAYQRGEFTHIERNSVPVRFTPQVWKNAISNRVEKCFNADTAAFIKALLVGERVDIDYETNTAFKVSGISHIIAVSGLHMSVLFGAVYALTARNRWLSALLGIPIMLMFAAIVGFTPSVTRACIMQSVMLIGLLCKREYDQQTALAAAVALMIFANPMVVTSVSFQLSVGCVIGIILFSGRIMSWLLERKWLSNVKGKGILPRLRRWFISSVSISISASLMTTPLVAYYFETVSLVSILTNLLTVWLVSYIFMLAAAALVLSLVSMHLATLIGSAVGLMVSFVVGTAKLLARIPLAAFYTQSDAIFIWLIGAYLLLVLFLVIKKHTVLIYTGIVTAGLIAALAFSWIWPQMDECRVSVLNVGQGQCILLQSDGKTFLVDCGGNSDTSSADLAAQMLMSQGVFKLDGIFLTHYDRDHIGGIPYLLSRVNTSAIFLPVMDDSGDVADGIIERTDGKVFWVGEDTYLTFADTKITLFAPEFADKGNEYCMCVLFQTENYDILITGDRDTTGERKLLSRVDLPELEVLIAGHHGSAYATGDQLLTETKPKLVLISAGKNNRYGHPAPALLERLEQHGCYILRTDQCGSIIFRG